MDVKAYIASGILELYVAGILSEEENQEVYTAMQQHPEIREEVERIEQTVRQVTASVSPSDTSNYEERITKAILGESDADEIPIVPLAPKKTNWLAYSGWAAAVLLGAGLFYLQQQHKDLKSDIQTTEIENNYLEQQIEQANQSLEASRELVEILRDKNISTTNLAGQTVSPESYAKVYWNQETQTVYIDALGLPEPPPGKVYQVWSLTLNPLTPTSLGLLEDFVGDDNKIFALANANASEAFGITLEPAGGSESPTLEQLYTLGVVKS